MRRTVPVLEAVRSTLSAHRMLKAGETVLVGISGGPDSTALLWALAALRAQWSIRLRALYVDHGLRPSAVGREKAFVRRVGKMWGVPVSCAKASVRRAPGESPEAAARRVRYDCFIRTALRFGCRTVAVGHTRDDQAETVLMWLLRGTGTQGLGGIPPLREIRIGRRRLRIVRPLLACSREEIASALRRGGVRPCRDASNRSARFLRNRLRTELIPLLERRYNPRLKDHLAELAGIVREERTWLEAEAVRLLKAGVRPAAGGLRIDRRFFGRQVPAVRRQALRLAVGRLQGNLWGFTAWHWRELDRLVTDPASKAADLPHRFRAEPVNGRWLRLTRRRSQPGGERGVGRGRPLKSAAPRAGPAPRGQPREVESPARRVRPVVDSTE